MVTVVQSANYYHYHTPFGALTLRSSNQGITHVCLGKKELHGTCYPSIETTRAANELFQYFAHKKTSFDFPINPEGSSFQLKVWQVVKTIPFGETLSLQEIAEKLAMPDACRSVAAALHQNPLRIVIPDHRVITAQRKPIGSGRDAQLRGALLRFETSASSRQS